MRNGNTFSSRGQGNRHGQCLTQEDGQRRRQRQRNKQGLGQCQRSRRCINNI